MPTPKATAGSEAVGIRSRVTKLLAWLVFSAALLATLGFIVLRVNSQHLGIPGLKTGALPLIGALLSQSLVGLAMMLTSVIGLIILYRSSNWQIGWLLTSWGGLIGLFSLSQEYAEYAFRTRPGATLPLKWPAAWFQHSAPALVFGLIAILLPQLFPTGRPLSPRWRVVFRLSLLFLALVTVVIGFAKVPLGNALTGLDVMNPYGFISFGESGEFAAIANLVFVGLFITFALLAIASLFLRYLRSRGYERQQMKWIAYALTPWVVSFLIISIANEIRSPLLEVLGSVVGFIGVLGLPLAIGFAILKYRLYDIDRIINRTLVYGVLTATLALAYFLSVVLLEQVFPAESQISIVISTLAIAALFAPLRRRIQNFIDRRFYRQKYDAQKVLGALSETLRDEVDLDRLTASILEVVDDTMQPAHASLWLKPTE